MQKESVPWLKLGILLLILLGVVVISGMFYFYLISGGLGMTGHVTYNVTQESISGIVKNATIAHG